MYELDFCIVLCPKVRRLLLTEIADITWCIVLLSVVVESRAGSGGKFVAKVDENSGVRLYTNDGAI